MLTIESGVCMVVGLMKLDLLIPGCNSLKEKRRVIKSLINKVKNQFNAAVNEVDHHDLWQRATIGIACISQSSFQAKRTLHTIERFIEQMHSVSILKTNVSIMTPD